MCRCRQLTLQTVQFRRLTTPVSPYESIVSSERLGLKYNVGGGGRMQGDGGVTDQPPTAEPLSIWRNPDFLLLWSGRSVSALGSSVSSIAFPS
jgi:hypothetical protein